ncbi:MAG: FAD binding domain-containing protein, partial [Hylemonella sp.]
LALDASFVLTGPKGQRVVKADGYFLGLYSTLLEPGEILTQIRIPVPPAGTGTSYQKLKRKTGDYATAASAVADEGRCGGPGQDWPDQCGGDSLAGKRG